MSLFSTNHIWGEKTSSCVVKTVKVKVVQLSDLQSNETFMNLVEFCWRCNDELKLTFLRECVTCHKLSCKECLVGRGSWLHSGITCDYCRGVADTHSIYYFCCPLCIDAFLKLRSRKRFWRVY